MFSDLDINFELFLCSQEIEPQAGTYIFVYVCYQLQFPYVGYLKNLLALFILFPYRLAEPIEINR